MDTEFFSNSIFCVPYLRHSPSMLHSRGTLCILSDDKSNVMDDTSIISQNYLHPNSQEFEL